MVRIRTNAPRKNEEVADSLYSFFFLPEEVREAMVERAAHPCLGGEGLGLW